MALLRTSLYGMSRSAAHSRGMPSTRSAMMLRWISLLPPARLVAWRSRKSSPASRPSGLGARGPRDRVGAGELEADLGLALGRRGGEELGDRGGLARRARRCSMPRLTRCTRPRCTTSSTCASATSWRATGSSAVPRAVTSFDAAGVERAVGTLGEVVAPAHVGRPAADRVALVREQRERDGPAVVHLADDRVGREPDVVEELLAELERPVDLLDRVDLHARAGGSP